MTYNSFLDTYFSTRWFGYGVPALLVILYGVFRKQLIDNKKNKFTWHIIYLAVPFVFAITYALINPIFWGWGNPLEVDQIKFEKGKLYVLDYTLSGGGRNVGPEQCERLHILDPQTGVKQIRFRVGDQGEFVGVHGDSVCVARYNDVAYFSNSTGHLFAVYNTESLPKYYSQLSAGINNYMWGDGRNIMEISAMNGTNWNLYTATGHLVSTDTKSDNEPREEYVPTNKLSIHEREVRIDNGPGANTFLELSGVNENQYKRFIVDRHDSILNPDLFFLDGMPVGLDIQDSCFFVLHYETLTKEKFMLSCISLDGKKQLWQIKQSDLNPTFKFPDSVSPSVEADEANHRLFFNVGTEVFAVNMKDGKLLWRTKL